VWRWSTQPRQSARAQLIRSKFEGSATFARVFRFLWVRAASSCAFRAAPSAQEFAEQCVGCVVGHGGNTGGLKGNCCAQHVISIVSGPRRQAG
jgi:hypothetical protein